MQPCWSVCPCVWCGVDKQRVEKIPKVKKIYKNIMKLKVSKTIQLVGYDTVGSVCMFACRSVSLSARRRKEKIEEENSRLCFQYNHAKVCLSLCLS